MLALFKIVAMAVLLLVIQPSAFAKEKDYESFRIHVKIQPYYGQSCTRSFMLFGNGDSYTDSCISLRGKSVQKQKGKTLWKISS